MSIDWSHFTPLSSLGGGALIGLAAALLYVAGGRIAGISGIFAQTVLLRRDGLAWRLAFLTGLIAAPWLLPMIRTSLAQSVQVDQLGLLFFAGALTGYGTRVARGCTSGHGICGLSRLSRRSLVAVLCFMAAGMVTVTLVRHVAWGAL